MANVHGLPQRPSALVLVGTGACSALLALAGCVSPVHSVAASAGPTPPETSRSAGGEFSATPRTAGGALPGRVYPLPVATAPASDADRRETPTPSELSLYESLADSVESCRPAAGSPDHREESLLLAVLRFEFHEAASDPLKRAKLTAVLAAHDEKVRQAIADARSKLGCPAHDEGSSNEAAPDAGESSAPFNRGAAAAALASVDVATCKKADGPTGSGHVSVTFAPSGAVETATVDSPAFEGTGVGGCVAGKFRSARIPAFSGAAQRVGKSFTLR
jgi:hypothetical protein